jgi:hypothetical protein
MQGAGTESMFIKVSYEKMYIVMFSKTMNWAVDVPKASPLRCYDHGIM